MLEVLWLPFLACLVLTGIHAYLGLHVLARGVIFVDLALAQVAALGMSVAFLAGHPIQSPAAYWYALTFTVAGAALFSLTRTRRAPIPQEAIIGIVYAVAAAAAILVVDRVPQGNDYVKQLLVGNLLTVSGDEVRDLALLYAAIGALHWLVRRPLLDLSLGARARMAPWRVAAWDFVFYASFGVVVTSSVRAAGVLLVFSYLIVPAAAGALLARSVGGRLLVGWALGAVVSVVGLAGSYALDLPTGAAVVVTFGVLIGAVALGLAGRALAAGVRRRGARALAGVGLASSVLVALAGGALAVLPGMDHLWLDALEGWAPGIRLAFLTPVERAAHAESREAMARAQAEIARLRALQQDVQWGRVALDAERAERLRQFVTGRAEIQAGDRLVVDTLRRKARERQRYALGVPLLALGVAGAAVVGLAAGRRREAMAGTAVRATGGRA